MIRSSIGGRYEVEGQLGAGSSGVIYLGKDSATGDRVAIKSFHRTGMSVRPALHEASAILGVAHRNIVRCLDFSYPGDGDLYLIYEYVNGGSLREVLEEKGKLELDEALEIMRQILSGLSHLHMMGWIHCDVKPENILLNRSGDITQYKLGDLGVAHFLRHIDKTHRIAGTPAYMAPERLHGQFGYNSDLYSLGVVFYEMIKGRLPFEGGPAQLARAHRSEKVVLEDLADARVRDFLSSLLEKDPGFRIERAEDALRIVQSLRGRSFPGKSEASAVIRNGKSLGTAPPPSSEGSLEEIGNYELNARYEQIYPFSTERGPILALEYAAHIEFVDGRDGSPLDLLIPIVGVCVQPVSASTLTYSTRSRICMMDLEKQEEVTLLENCPRNFGIWYDKGTKFLLWADSKEAHMVNTASGSRELARFPCSNFGLNACLRFMEGDMILYTTGPVNPAVHLADFFGKTLHSFPVEGPVLGVTNGANEFLILTLSKEGESRLVLYHLNSDLKLRKRVLPKSLVNVALTSDCFYGQFKNGALMSYRGRFHQRNLEEWMTSTRNIFVTPDNRYLFRVSEIQSKTHVSCFINHEQIS